MFKGNVIDIKPKYIHAGMGKGNFLGFFKVGRQSEGPTLVDEGLGLLVEESSDSAGCYNEKVIRISCRRRHCTY